MSSSHLKTEKALDDFLQAFQKGTASIKSKEAIKAVYEESMEVAWPHLLAALEDFGLDQESAKANHLFIVDWLAGVMMDGLLSASGEVEADRSSSSSASSFNDSTDDASKSVYSFTSNETEPEEYPGVLDEFLFPHKPALSHPGPEEFQYLKPFGQLGRIVAKEVRSGWCTFKDDLNRAREYWRRGHWEEVKSYLLRILVVAQRPNHRQSDLSARTAAYLLGIAYNNSGDFDTAIQIMLSVMTPFDYDDEEPGPYDDGHIAAATWLGDLCLKTNKIECAALAWAMAYDAANARSTRLSQGHPANSDIPSSDQMFPAPLNAASRRPTSLSRTFRLARAQAIAILNRLESVNRKIKNLDALTESLASGWRPDNADAVFTQSQLLSLTQMQRVVKKAKDAIETAMETAVESTSGSTSRHSPVIGSKGHSRDVSQNSQLPKALPSAPPPLPPRRSIFSLPSGNSTTDEISSLLIPAEDVLQTPVRSFEWPLAYDVEFSRSAAIKTINWVHSFTPLDLEDVMSKIVELDFKQYRTIYPGMTRPMYVSERFDPKKTEDSSRFLVSVQKTLDTLGFEHLEEPGLFRCRHRTNRSSRWPSIACFALHIIKYKAEGGFKRGPKFAAYITDVVHWNGQTENIVMDHAETKLLVREINSTLHLFESEERDIWRAVPRAMSSRSSATRAPSRTRTPLQHRAIASPPPPPPKKVTISSPQEIIASGPLHTKANETFFFA